MSKNKTLRNHEIEASVSKWLIASPEEKEEMGNPFIQVIKNLGETAPVVPIPDGFSDYEMARDEMIENQIDDAIQAKHEKLEARENIADCHASPEDGCEHCQELGLER